MEKDNFEHKRARACALNTLDNMIKGGLLEVKKDVDIYITFLMKMKAIQDETKENSQYLFGYCEKLLKEESDK